MRRITAIKFFYFLLLFLISIRLFFWQVIKADELSSRAERQRTNTLEVSGKRGNIFFADGSPLATSKPAFLLYLQPKLIKKNEPDLKLYSRKLAQLLPSKEDKPEPFPQIATEIQKQVERDLYWVSLGYVLDTEQKKALEKENIYGLGFERISKRFYPEGSSSAHLLGFVGSDIYGEEAGYFGIEGFYNGELKGKKGVKVFEKDALGSPILIGKLHFREPKNGKTLKLYLDRSVQYIVEKHLQDGIEKYGAQGASAVVMDPKTGGILGMASYPAYDPQNPQEFPSQTYKNPLTADGYEPGSTFKVIVMAAALNDELVKPDTKCDACLGPVNISGNLIRTWNNKYRPDTTITEVIVHSDNTGMVFTGKKLGIDKFYSYIKKFGFGASSGIDLQDERSPQLRSQKDWKEIDLATASFGQGISVTALQIVRAVGALANEGKLMVPTVVAQIQDGKEVTKVIPKVEDTPIKPETAKTITEIMVKAVEEGEAKWAKPKGYKIAGKTGTAQIPVAGHYDPDKTIASFVGFAPADNPKFVMLVRYDQPSSSPYGAETAAPTFFEIAKDLFLYYGIAPSE